MYKMENDVSGTNKWRVQDTVNIHSGGNLSPYIYRDDVNFLKCFQMSIKALNIRIQNGWMSKCNKSWNTHTMEYYAAIRRNELALLSLDLEGHL